MFNFTDVTWSAGEGLKYTAPGQSSMEEVDSWWQEITFGPGGGLLSCHATEVLLLALKGLALRGKFTGYDFLFQMPDWEQDEWIRKAHRQCRREHKADPSAFPAGGVKDSLDRLRALRKERTKLKRLAKSETKSIPCDT